VPLKTAPPTPVQDGSRWTGFYAADTAAAVGVRKNSVSPLGLALTVEPLRPSTHIPGQWFSSGLADRKTIDDCFASLFLGRAFARPVGSQ